VLHIFTRSRGFPTAWGISFASLRMTVRIMPLSVGPSRA
jgi:hypothetical protein